MRQVAKKKMAGGSRVGRDGVLRDTKDVDIPANYNVSRTLLDQNWRDEQQRILMQVCVCVCACVCVCVCVVHALSSQVLACQMCVFAFVVREAGVSVCFSVSVSGPCPCPCLSVSVSVSVPVSLSLFPSLSLSLCPHVRGPRIASLAK
jgi:hypothetical protein